MKATFSRTISSPFIVSIDTASAICKLLKGKVGPVTITVSCEDDIERSFDSVKKLGQYENPKGRRIVSMDFAATSESFQKSASVSFSNSRYSPISIRATAREDVIVRLRNSLLEIVEHCRPWYWPINRINIWAVMFAISFIVSITLACILVFIGMAYSVSVPEDFRILDLLWPIFFGFVGGAVILGLTRFLTWLRDCLFPRAMYLVGHEINRYALLEKIHWGGIIALGISLISGTIILIVQSTWT